MPDYMGKILIEEVLFQNCSGHSAYYSERSQQATNCSLPSLFLPPLKLISVLKEFPALPMCFILQPVDVCRFILQECVSLLKGMTVNGV